mmetsp:Transcript_46835/g.145018  ORF Transcript_46835/g.145018 Transcript_46835/m.145018 type:complete len:227 (+) Transcript_46835:655-1335(+)
MLRSLSAWRSLSAPRRAWSSCHAASACARACSASCADCLSWSARICLSSATISSCLSGKSSDRLRMAFLSSSTSCTSAWMSPVESLRVLGWSRSKCSGSSCRPRSRSRGWAGSSSICVGLAALVAPPFVSSRTLLRRCSTSSRRAAIAVASLSNDGRPRRLGRDSISETMPCTRPAGLLPVGVASPGGAAAGDAGHCPAGPSSSLAAGCSPAGCFISSRSHSCARG